VALQQYFSHSRLFISKLSPFNSRVKGQKSEPTHYKPSEPINRFGQSRAGVRLCCGFCQPEHIEKKMLNHNHLTKTVGKFFTDLHPQYAV
jgi:hypothetical protein